MTETRGGARKGAGRPKKQHARTVSLWVTLTRVEAAQVKRDARAKGCSTNDLIRQKLGFVEFQKRCRMDV